mmetsp:Transcript_1046/g.1706  ORF Transcript_1046/g.1706 Transcript_1046/m.1706 type:complete len:656 (-) Transcript_1046:223-2190(-)
MHCFVASVIVALFVVGVCASDSGIKKLKSYAEISASFLKDGYRITQNATSPSHRYRGYLAESLRATTYDSGKPKKAYYIEGDSHALGWLHGTLSARIGDARAICTTYVHHIIVNLLSESWDEEMASKCEGWVPGDLDADNTGTGAADTSMSCETYENLLTFMEKWLIAGSVKSFHAEKEKFPQALVEEMHAFVEGAVAEDDACGCTYEKLVYLNYGIDFIMSALYAGSLPHILSQAATEDVQFQAQYHHHHQQQKQQQKQNSFARQIDEILAMSLRAFKNPIYCNSFAMAGAATASGRDVFMSRDFQLPTGLVYQDVAADIIFVPTDGRKSHVSSGAPGFIGRVTVLNQAGVAMGVDMLRAAPTTPETPGMNSILLLRQVADQAGNTSHAVELIAETQRGTTWLYPLCDAQGDCRVIEAGKYLPPGQAFDPLQYIDNDDLKAVLPSASFYQKHSSDDIFDRGMYTRPINWVYPAEYLDYNEALYDFAGVSYDASDETWGATGYLFEDFEEENEITKQKLHNNFFPPQRESFPDMCVISNNALVPEFRTSMMSRAGNFWEVTAHAAQWRYDTLNDQLTGLYGKVTIKDAIEVAEFLSPEKTPGYWTNTIDDTDPMSAIVEGTMNVIHLNELRLYTKTGYWADAWTHISLRNFLLLQ